MSESIWKYKLVSMWENPFYFYRFCLENFQSLCLGYIHCKHLEFICAFKKYFLNVVCVFRCMKWWWSRELISFLFIFCSASVRSVFDNVWFQIFSPLWALSSGAFGLIIFMTTLNIRIKVGQDFVKKNSTL